MNLMGKIFTLLIFFLSITFLVLAVMVGASHRNWKAIASDNKDQATLAKNRLEQSRAASNEYVRKLNSEQVSRQQQLSQLFAQKQINESRLDKEATQNRIVSEKNAQLLAELKIANQRLVDQDKEVADLKAGNKNLIEDIAVQRESVVSLTTKIYELRGQVQALDLASKSLTAKSAKRIRIMKANGLTLDSLTDHIAKPLDGIVTRFDKDFIAVSLGTDDGLKIGHFLDVYRGKRYVGRAEVTRAEHNISAARLLPEFQQTVVKEGDIVTTKF